MQVIVNNQEIQISLEDEKTLGDFLKAFEQNCADNDATIIGIAVNDEQLSADTMEKSFILSLDEVSKVELSTVSSTDIAGSLKDLAKQSGNIADNLCTISMLYQAGKDKEASAFITEFADFFNGFCRTISLSSLFPKTYGTLRIENLEISQFLSDFSQLLSDFEKALKDNDIVLIGDLAEYEIAPRLHSIANLAAQ